MQEKIFLPKNLYYRINDFKKNRPTIIFIHGLIGSSSAWLKYEQKFQDQFNIVSLDLRGHGKSIKPSKEEDYQIESFVSDIQDLVNYLKLDNFTLISHSFGTIIALAYLMVDQKKVKSAIFLSPVFNPRQRKKTVMIQPLLALSNFFNRRHIKLNTGKHVDYDNFKNTGDWSPRRMLADIRNTSWPVFIYCLKQSYHFNGEQYIGQVKKPVLIIHGKKDTISPVAHSVKAAKKINQAKLIVLEKADHVVVLNNFSEISEAIEKFICNNI